jgi:hypothetical protein
MHYRYLRCLIGFAWVCVYAVTAGINLLGCHPTPGPAPMPPEAGDASWDAPGSDAAGDSYAPPVSDAAPTACMLACNALRAAGCPLGSTGDCAAFLQRDLGSGKVANAASGKPLTCVDVEGVRTKPDAVKLGFACQ